MGIKDLFKKKTESQDASAKSEKPKETAVKAGNVVVEKKESASVKAVSGKKKINKENTGNAYKILVKPLVTEKATMINSQNQYVFAVTVKANGTEVKKAITKVYGVTPIKVNIMNTPGKNVRWGRKGGKRKDWKKAIVILKPGDKIEITEGI